MVDTIRSLSALQALLADNTTGDISPQDMRDFLVSVYGVYSPSTIGEYDDYFLSNAAGNWTTVAPDTGSVTWTYNIRQPATRGLYAAPVDVVATDLGAYVKPLTGITTTDYIQTSISAGGASSSAFALYLVFTTGTTSAANLVGIGLDYDATAFPIVQNVEGSLTSATFAGDFNMGQVRGSDRPIHLRMTYNSTTSYGVEVSLDGDNWQSWGNIAVTAMTPTHGGFAVTGDGTATATTQRTLFRADYFHSNVTS